MKATAKVQGAVQERRQGVCELATSVAGRFFSSAISLGRGAVTDVVEGTGRVVKANKIVFDCLWDINPGYASLRMATGVAAFAAPPLGWWGSSLMIDALSSGGSAGALRLGAGLTLGSLVLLGCTPVLLSCLERLGDNNVFELVFGRFTRKMITFSQEDLGDAELSDDIKRVRERAVWRMMALARTMPQMVRCIGSLAVAAGLVLWMAPELLLIMLMASVWTTLTELAHARRRCEIDEELAPDWNGLWGDLANLMMLPSLQMLALFGATEWFQRRYEEGLAKTSQVECLHERQGLRKRILAALMVGIGLTISIWLLIERTRAGAISVGEFVFLLGALSNLAACLADSASLMGLQLNNSQSVIELLVFLAHPFSPEVPLRPALESKATRAVEVAPQEEAPTPNPSEPHVEFINVRKQYGADPSAPFALNGVTFAIPRGAIVAVVGPNGAGKSTTMSLLMRQHRPTAGEIRIGGRCIRGLTAREFSAEVVMMPQHMRHLNLPVKQLLNLGRANSPATDEVLWEELRRINAAGFVEKREDGLDTVLGADRNGKVEPSGGELQRLILAAVGIAGRELIVLDEPVSMVDPEAAKDFWDAVFQERGDRTVIFSTHHLGAVRRADTILFIKDAIVAAQGDHETLMATCDKYRKVFEAQATDYR